MIYASLKPIRAWHNLWTLPGYLAMGLASGALWFTLWAELMPAVQKPAYDFAAIGLAAAIALKLTYWRFLDSGAHAATAESATGLGAFGKVRMLTAPHTEENYLHEGDGLPRRAQACAEAAPHRALRRLRAAARRRHRHRSSRGTSSTLRCSRSRSC